MAKLTNYTGSVELISGIKQKNNGDFPLLEANAIQVNEDGKRLDEVIGTLDELQTTNKSSFVAAINEVKNTSSGNDDVGSLDNLQTTDKSSVVAAVNEVKGETAGLKADLDTLNQGGLNLKEDFIGKQVNGWLDKHPEATTTVQDGSINEYKFTNELRKKKANYYTSVEKMKEDISLIVDTVCVTLGYYKPNDGGGATYRVREKKTSDIDDGGSIHILANNNYVAELISGDYVTPEMFGAKGDGVADDTNAFEKALNFSGIIKCGREKIYNFLGVINARNKCAIIFDGNNSKFKNFAIELWLKDDSYENRGGTSLAWESSKFTNMQLGSGFYDFEDKWNVPTITSGCWVECENIIMCGHMVLLAYTNTYLDKLHLKNIVYSMGNVVSEDVKDYNTVMFVDADGTLNKWNGGTQGDNWVFENVAGASFHKDGIEFPFGLVSLSGNKNAVFRGCINPTIYCGYLSTASVLDCHFENLSGLYPYDKNNNLTGTEVIVERCYFHGISRYPLVKGFAYYNCCFDIRDSDTNRLFSSIGTNLLKATTIRDCSIGYSKELNNSTDLEPPYSNNYLDLNNYSNIRDIIIAQSTDTIYSWENGNYTIDVFMKTLYESNVYFKKKSATLEITENKNIFICSVENPIPSEIDIYVTTPSGKIYNAKGYLDKPAISISFKLYRTFYSTHINDTRDKYKDVKLLPYKNTLEFVDAIPEYVERTDVYCLGKNMYVSTKNENVVNSNYARIDSSMVEIGGGY